VSWIKALRISAASHLRNAVHERDIVFASAIANMIIVMVAGRNVKMERIISLIQDVG
jgi:hypothetical protein